MLIVVRLGLLVIRIDFELFVVGLFLLFTYCWWVNYCSVGLVSLLVIWFWVIFVVYLLLLAVGLFWYSARLAGYTGMLDIAYLFGYLLCCLFRLFDWACWLHCSVNIVDIFILLISSSHLFTKHTFIIHFSCKHIPSTIQYFYKINLC